jgi:peptidoglycan/LPS O-acetylase OafA/YrhL
MDSGHCMLLRALDRWGMSISYRRDIDGLRAISVTAVVAYHVGVPGFGGGFIGVDVFFVISGFLITTLLLDELRQHGSIDLLTFYVRRARRLLPAFFVVVAATLLLGAFFLLPVYGEQQALARTARAALVYFSNLHFARTTGGYFDTSSELLPLLHTWSLAVEEQFYLVWPLLLIACAWIAQHRKWRVMLVIAAALSVIFSASLIYSHVMAGGSEKAVRFAFFGLPSRAWELAVGAVLALTIPHISTSGVRFSGVLAGAGLLAIAVAIASFQQGMPFPGLPALLPTLGAAAIIAGGWFAPQSWVSRLLSTRPFVAVGLLSYSWYLWHWPLLAIARAYNLGAHDMARDVAIAFAALGLAWLTYIWVEQPIRGRRILEGWSRTRTLGVSAAASLALIAGTYGLQTRADQLSKNDGYRRISHAFNDATWNKANCHYSKGKCAQAADVPNRGLVVLWGDSHADHIAGTVHKAVAPHGLSLLSRDMGGCPPVTDAVVFSGPKQLDECSKFNAAVLAEIDNAARRGELVAVVLSARWPIYLGQPKFSGEPSPRVLALPGQPPSIDAAPAALRQGLRATVAALLKRGIKVLVIAPAPEHRYNIPKCLARRAVGLCDTLRQEAEKYRAAALAELRAVLGNTPGVRLWDPFMGLCNNERCHIQRDGVILYYDDNHLTYSGSQWLASYFSEEATWLARATGASSSLHDDRLLGR